MTCRRHAPPVVTPDTHQAGGGLPPAPFELVSSLRERAGSGPLSAVGLSSRHVWRYPRRQDFVAHSWPNADKTIGPTMRSRGRPDGKKACK
jgi:hypothetical protein